MSVAVGVLGLGVIAAAVAAVMWGRSATETAYLDIDDAGAEAVELTLKRDGAPIAERTRERKFALPPGVYTVEVSAPDPAVRLSGGLVTLGRGDREKLTLRVNRDRVLARKLDDYNPDDPEWLKLFLKQPPRVQVARFTKELQRLNPDFDGKVTFQEEDGKVVELRVPTDAVADMSPLRALRHLRRLYAEAIRWGGGRFTDLAVLRGLRLTSLQLFRNAPARNTDALAGMPLDEALLNFSKAENCRVLHGMKFRNLFLFCPEPIDLALLRPCLADRALLAGPRGHNLAGLGDHVFAGPAL